MTLVEFEKKTIAIRNKLSNSLNIYIYTNVKIIKGNGGLKRNLKIQKIFFLSPTFVQV